MIIFIRHAERGDNQIPVKLSQITYDPPITEPALATISQTSSQLSAIFKQHEITKLQIYSSKFLRCIMTANGIESILKKQGFSVGELYKLDDQICEFLRDDWFETYPLQNLIYQTQHFHKYIPGGIKFQQTNLKLQFPENYPQFHQRVGAFRNSLKFPEKGTCKLVVTHGFVVRELCFRMNKLPQYQNEIKYCGYAAYMKDEEKGEMLVKAKL